MLRLLYRLVLTSDALLSLAGILWWDVMTHSECGGNVMCASPRMVRRAFSCLRSACEDFSPAADVYCPRTRLFEPTIRRRPSRRFDPRRYGLLCNWESMNKAWCHSCAPSYKLCQSSCASRVGSLPCREQSIRISNE